MYKVALPLVYKISENGFSRRILSVACSLLMTGIIFSTYSISAPGQTHAEVSKKDAIFASEKSSYDVSDVVQLSGSGYMPHEAIFVEASYLDRQLEQYLAIDRFDVFADAKGSVELSWVIPKMHEAEVTFALEATGLLSGKSAIASFSSPIAGESVSIAQCANSNANPQNLDCPGMSPTGWVSGDVGTSKSKYFEGNSIPYRAVFQNLEVGDTYKWTVEYDTSKSGKNTIDYLTTYNRTITNANPCQSGATANAFCTPGAPDDTEPIPTDPNVTNGRDGAPGGGDDIAQVAGVISSWGVDITGVSLPSYTGTFPTGDSTATVDISFVANSTTAVLAWGGHIATRNDWGQANGATNLPGSPYHTSNGGLMNVTDSTSCCTGSQDLSLKADAVIMTAKIIIKKHATPPSQQVFGFTTTNLSPSTFTLRDTAVGNDPMRTFDAISTFNLKTIEETSFGPYTLVSIVCTVDMGAGGTPQPVRMGNAIEIDIKSGDQVTCTFNNDLATAAAISLHGQVFDPEGRAVRWVTVRLSGLDGTNRFATTNHFGYFRFDEVSVGQSYVLEANHKQFTYSPQVITVDEDIGRITFHPTGK